MDTKLKNSNGKTAAYILLFIFEMAAAISLAVCGSIFAAIGNMSWLQEIDPAESDWYAPYYGQITDQARYDSMQNTIGIGGIILVGIAAAVLLAMVLLAGRGKTDENGRICLNWFDRIWSEIQITLASLAGVWFGSIVLLLYDVWMRGDYLGIWENTSDQDGLFYSAGVVTREIEMTYCIAGLLVSTFVFLLCMMSMIKKIKARQFWEKSLLGGAFLAVYRSFKSSDKTLFKIMAAVIIGAFCCATWFGLPVVLVIVLIIVPKSVRKFTEIKKGVEEVKNGNLTYKIPVEEDIKGIRGELDRLASEINDISQASNIAVQNEIKNQRMKTDLISNVSHDLKTPLTSMISYVDLMKKEGLDSPNAPEYLDIIDSKTQRLKTLTENLFEAAKASSGAIPVNMEPIDLSSLLSQSMAEMEEKLMARGLDIQVKNQCEGIKVMADGQLMWRVIENLLGNVSKYAMDNSRVYIDINSLESKTESSKDMVILEMKNISKDQLNISADELMERFKRGDESRNTEGSGLGLAIAKDLMKLMNGVFEITVDGDLFKATVMLEKA